MSMVINGTAGATYPDGVTQASGVPSPGTSGNVLTSDGTLWTSAANPPAFVAGTRLGFQQTAAPTGWTKDTTAAINDSILRFVTGTASSGGSTAFSTFNAQTATSAYTLATTDIPSHTHTYQNIYVAGSTGQPGTGFANGGTTTTSATGGGGSHSHGLTTSIKYYDFIIASKN